MAESEKSIFGVKWQILERLINGLIGGCHVNRQLSFGLSTLDQEHHVEEHIWAAPIARKECGCFLGDLRDDGWTIHLDIHTGRDRIVDGRLNSSNPLLMA
ncbi:hypothetical protein VdG1_06296 [Verticillium dahliae VDG1]|nr:hypothetical protein VdG1_06296 [Verticillium dahliae VDG1]